MTVNPERADRLAALVAERGLDALLVSDRANVRYLTGFTGSNGIAVVGADGTRRFVTDFRYVTQAAEQVGDAWERPPAERDLLGEGFEAALGNGSIRLLGFDDAHLPVRDHSRIAAREGLELVAAGGLVEELRKIKEPQEIALIRQAAAIADEAFENVVARGLVGRPERDVAVEIEAEMVRLGADAPSFDTIVASGTHGGRPHAAPRDEPIPLNALVTIDWGARVGGYCSDCTRTVATGTVGSEATEVYELVRRAQLAGAEAVSAGRSGREVDHAAREVIEAGGHGAEFGHGLGHGVGLEVHEGPTLSQRAGDERLVVGNVVTIEPGVYVAEQLGVRIEDLVVVRDDGAEILTSLPKTLRFVD